MILEKHFREIMSKLTNLDQSQANTMENYTKKI